MPQCNRFLRCEMDSFGPIAVEVTDKGEAARVVDLAKQPLPFCQGRMDSFGTWLIEATRNGALNRIQGTAYGVFLQPSVVVLRIRMVVGGALTVLQPIPIN